MITKPRISVPTYRLHRRTARAVVTVRNLDGSRRDILLPGEFNSDESRHEYERVLALLRTNNGCMSVAGQGDLTINELALRFMTEHVTPYYVNPNTKEPTGEQENFICALRPLTRLFGDLPSREFGPQALRTVREAMISGSWLTAEEQTTYRRAKKPKGIARSTINQRIGKIKHMFKWGVEMQVVPSSVLHGLQAVAGLCRGRSDARETAPVVPVDFEAVEQTLPFLPPVARDVVRLLRLSGARVGELCQLRMRDLDRTGPVWLYRLQKHKTTHHGHSRTIAFGPQAQLILCQYLKADPDAFLFSPREQDKIIKAQKRKQRRTPVQPSQVNRRKTNARRMPGECFDADAINRAIRRGCEKAGIPIWHTHQLRHTAALLIEREFGLDAARAALGHRTANLTAMYSGIDVQKAAQVMAKIG